MVYSTDRRDTLGIEGVCGNACGVNAGVHQAWFDALTRSAVDIAQGSAVRTTIRTALCYDASQKVLTSLNGVLKRSTHQSGVAFFSLG